MSTAAAVVSGGVRLNSRNRLIGAAVTLPILLQTDDDIFYASFEKLPDSIFDSEYVRDKDTGGKSNAIAIQFLERITVRFKSSLLPICPFDCTARVRHLKINYE